MGAAQDVETVIDGDNFTCYYRTRAEDVREISLVRKRILIFFYYRRLNIIRDFQCWNQSTRPSQFTIINFDTL